MSEKEKGQQEELETEGTTGSVDASKTDSSADVTAQGNSTPEAEQESQTVTDSSSKDTSEKDSDDEPEQSMRAQRLWNSDPEHKNAIEILSVSLDQANR